MPPKLIQVKEGRKYVGSARLVYDSPDCAVIEIGMRLKRPEVFCHECLATGVVGIYGSAGADSLFNGIRVPRGSAEFHIVFPRYHGWRLYASATIGRYAIAITLLRSCP
jgi:hypothetical protein